MLSVGLVASLGLGLAVVITLVRPPRFRAEARILVEQVSSGSSVLRGLANLPTDLAGLVGGAPQTAAEMEVLRSRPVIRAVVGPRGTSEVVPGEGLTRTVLVDDLSRQSLWEKLRRRLRGEGPPVGGLSVEVEAWDFPHDFDHSVRIEVLPSNRVRMSVDRLWERWTEERPVQAGGAVQWRGARLRLAPEGTDLAGLSGRSFLLTVRGLQAAVDALLLELVVDETDRGSNVVRVSFSDRDPDRVSRTVNALVRSYLAHNRARFLQRADRSAQFVDEEIGTLALPDAATAIVEKLVEVDLERVRTQLSARSTEDVLERIRSEELTVDDITSFEIHNAAASELLPLAELVSQKRVMEGVYQEDWPPLKKINARIEQRIASIQTGLENQVWRKERIAGDLSSILETYQGELESLPEAQLELARRIRNVKALTEIYLFLLGQKEEARIARTSAVPSVEVIDWAVPPLQRSSPRISLNLVLGLLFGLFVGSALAFLRELTRRPVVAVEKMERAAGAPHLPSVPLDRGGRKGLAAASAEGPAAEAYRALRTALRHGEARILTVSSSVGREGRSTIASQLACSMARGGERVLLVDADMRSPRLHRWFGGELGPGLAEALASGEGGTPRPTELDELFLLPAGQAGAHPGDLAAQPDAARVLADLARGFDRVILDTPAVLTGSEAPTLAAAAQGTLLVVRRGRTAEEDVAAASLRLRQAGATLVGAVLVGVPSRQR